MAHTWDYLILTASNDRQAKGYESQLAVRRRAGLLPEVGTALVVADPLGKRVGSGGSTLVCLMRVLAAEIQLGGHHVLMVGSRRLCVAAADPSRPSHPDPARGWRFPPRAGLWAVRQDFLARSGTVGAAR